MRLRKYKASKYGHHPQSYEIRITTVLMTFLEDKNYTKTLKICPKTKVTQDQAEIEIFSNIRLKCKFMKGLSKPWTIYFHENSLHKVL